MKTIHYLFILLFCFMVSCTNDEIHYEGDPYLHFITAGTSQFVDQGSGHKDVDIKYGTISKVSGDNEVKLVLDPSSTAKEGIDFQFVKGTDNPSGNVNGTFTIRLLESGASITAKKAVFKLQSNTIKNAIIDYQAYTVNMSLKCPATLMNANFKNTVAYWNNPNGNYDIVQSSAANQLKVKDFLDSGVDLVLNYNSDTYVVTVPDQYTGSTYTAAPYAGAQIWVKQSTDATQVSSFNPCTKVLTVYANYYLKGTAAAFGNKQESFIGN